MPFVQQIIDKVIYLFQAFTTEFKVHWGQHPLRPEFVESTYFLYKVDFFMLTFVNHVATQIDLLMF